MQTQVTVEFLCQTIGKQLIENQLLQQRVNFLEAELEKAQHEHHTDNGKSS